MPTYEYECLACGVHFERRQHFTDPPVHLCPQGHSRVRRVFSPPTIVFKGPGFYVTDNGHSGSGNGGRKKPKAETEKATTES